MQSYPTCAFPGCLNGGRRKKGLCLGHYSQSRTGRPLRPIWATQRRPGTPPRITCDEVMCPVPGLIGPCHVYRGGKNEGGYGSIGIEDGGGTALVHKYVWEKEIGPVPEGLVLDHQCRVHGCCNTDHLRPVTRKVNSTENVIGSAPQLMAAKTHCPQGHPYDEANTYWHVTADRTHRQCRECKRVQCCLAARRRRLKLKGVAQ